MQVIDAILGERAAQLRCECGGQKVLAVVADGFGEGVVKPARQWRTAALGEAFGTFPVLNGQDAGHDLLRDTCRRTGVAEPQEAVGLEEELRDRLVRARVKLGLQVVNILRHAGRVFVTVRICTHADGEIARVF